MRYLDQFGTKSDNRDWFLDFNDVSIDRRLALDELNIDGKWKCRCFGCPLFLSLSVLLTLFFCQSQVNLQAQLPFVYAIRNWIQTGCQVLSKCSVMNKIVPLEICNTSVQFNTHADLDSRRSQNRSCNVLLTSICDSKYKAHVLTKVLWRLTELWLASRSWSLENHSCQEWYTQLLCH